MLSRDTTRQARVQAGGTALADGRGRMADDLWSASPDTGTPHETRAGALVVSRDRLYAESLGELLSAAGIEVRVLGAAELVPELAAGRSSDVLIVELDDLAGGHLQLVEQARDLAPLMEIITISASPEVSEAVLAYRSGVFAVLQHPVAGDELVQTVGAAARRKRRAERRMRQLDAERGWEPAEPLEPRSRGRAAGPGIGPWRGGLVEEQGERDGEGSGPCSGGRAQRPDGGS